MTKRQIFYVFLAVVNLILIVIPALQVRLSSDSDGGLGMLLWSVYVVIPLLILDGILYLIIETLHQRIKITANFKTAKILGIISVLLSIVGLVLVFSIAISNYKHRMILGTDNGSPTIFDWIRSVTGNWEDLSLWITLIAGIFSLALVKKHNVKVRYLLAFMHIGIVLSGFIIYYSYPKVTRSADNVQEAKQYSYAIKNLDITQCDQITNQQEAHNCRIEIVTTTENMELCETLVGKATCRHNIAVKQANYELCLPLPDNEHLPFSNRYNCLSEIVKNTGNSEICKVIDEVVTKDIDDHEYAVNTCRKNVIKFEEHKTMGVPLE